MQVLLQTVKQKNKEEEKMESVRKTRPTITLAGRGSGRGGGTGDCNCARSFRLPDAKDMKRRVHTEEKNRYCWVLLQNWL